MDKKTGQFVHLDSISIETDDRACKEKESAPVDVFFSLHPDCDKDGTYMLDILEVVCCRSHVIKNKNEDPVYSNLTRISKECDKQMLIAARIIAP